MRPGFLLLEVVVIGDMVMSESMGRGGERERGRLLVLSEEGGMELGEQVEGALTGVIGDLLPVIQTVDVAH